MSRAVSPGSGKPYGLALVCRVWRAAARATVYRHRVPPRQAPPRRPGPIGAMPDAALVEAIRAVLAASPFHGEGHRKVLCGRPRNANAYLTPLTSSALLDAEPARAGPSTQPSKPKVCTRRLRVRCSALTIGRRQRRHALPSYLPADASSSTAP